MNFKFAEQINADLAHLAFSKALSTAETELQKIPLTPFHDVLGKSLTDQAHDLTTWINAFFKKASKKVNIKALYFEINEFDINTGLWYIDGFAYNNDGGSDTDDAEWLVDYAADSRSVTGTVCAIHGYEQLQNAFGTIELNTDTLQNARDWCQQIVIARFMELMHTSHQIAQKQHLEWATVPIYFTEHAYDFIVRSPAK